MSPTTITRQGQVRCIGLHRWKARQGKARQGKAEQGNARQDRTGQCKTGQVRARLPKPSKKKNARRLKNSRWSRQTNTPLTPNRSHTRKSPSYFICHYGMHKVTAAPPYQTGGPSAQGPYLTLSISLTFSITGLSLCSMMKSCQGNAEFSINANATCEP